MEDRKPLLPIAIAAVALVMLPVVFVGGAVVMTVVSTMSMTGALQEMQCTRGRTAGGSAYVGDGSSVMPVAGKWKYTDRFGMRYHPVEHVMKKHNGMDMATIPTGGEIRAFRAGTIKTVVHGNPGAGNFIEIDHGGGLVSRYLHLASTKVEVGEKVAVGQSIGVEGQTGAVTGAHLHFEIHRDGTAVDPAPILKKAGLTVPRENAISTAADTPTGSTGRDGKNSSAADAENALAADVSQQSADDGSDDSKGSGNKVGGGNLSVGPWGPQQVAIAKEIIDAGTQRGLDDWTITLAVMTAMAESSLQNLNHGDAVRNDTVGVFQEGPERGPLSQRMDPAGAANIFWDYLQGVEGYRDLAPTIAAHKTQANADPWHYEPMWDDAVRVVAKVKGNPDLVARYTGSGGSADCLGAAGGTSVPAMAAQGELPDPPGMSCPPSDSPATRGLQPVAERGLRCTAAAFPRISTMYGIGERAISGDHPNGYAVDFMIDNYRSQSGRALGWKIAEWNRQNAEDLGIQYIIFDQKIWSVDRADEGWRPMEDRGSDNQNHLNHAHISYS